MAGNIQPSELDVFVVGMEGEFDLSERARLLDAFAVAKTAPMVVVDLARTQYLDSTILECLVALESATSERMARLVLVGLRQEIRRIFEICSLDRLFDIRDKLSDVTGGMQVEVPHVRRLTLVSGRDEDRSSR